MDKAREKTDKLLKSVERRVEAVYRNNPSLLRVEKKYNDYMAKVAKAVKVEYTQFQREANLQLKSELKEAYIRQIKALTIQNKQYKSIIDEYTRVLADVNQEALDIVNAEMPRVYALNYDQVSEDCKKAGIKVNEKTDLL